MNRNYKNFLFCLAALLGIVTSLQAQINMPSPSPRVTVNQEVSLAKVTLDYGRPAVRERKIFGALIPFGKVWRTGANASTKITFDREVKIKDTKIPAGTYALYTIPNKAEWTVIIHKNTKLWGAGGYKAEEDLARFTFPVQKLKAAQETFSISLENFHANGSDLVIAWEKTKVAVPLFVDADSDVFKQIEENVVNAKGEVKAGTYFTAASFYYEKGKDIDKAKMWFDKAIELRPEAFWYIYKRAEVAYEQKDMATAKTMAEKSLSLAKAGPHDYGYIAKCELLLKKIK